MNNDSCRWQTKEVIAAILALLIIALVSAFTVKEPDNILTNCIIGIGALAGVGRDAFKRKTDTEGPKT